MKKLQTVINSTYMKIYRGMLFEYRSVTWLPGGNILAIRVDSDGPHTYDIWEPHKKHTPGGLTSSRNNIPGISVIQLKHLHRDKYFFPISSRKDISAFKHVLRKHITETLTLQLLYQNATSTGAIRQLQISELE